MCGLIAVNGIVSAAREVFVGLMNLQHRGQDGAGILAIDPRRKDGFHLQRGSGLVDNVFSERSFKNLIGTAALGHTRYATIGRDDPNLLQPFLDYRSGVGLAHNGNIVNFYAVKDKLVNVDVAAAALKSDSELILYLLAAKLRDTDLSAEDVFSAVKHCMNELVGSYSVACLTKRGDIFGFRDPYGIRPLVMGQRVLESGEKVFAIASESVALSFLEFTDIEEIAPGEVVHISVDGVVTRRIIYQERPAPCMFEWVYFARVESEFCDRSVYEARFKLGQVLAERVKHLNIEADVVVPVPETSRSSAVALAEALNLPFRELLIKNRYVNRTFILDGQESRQEAIKRKLYPIHSEFVGKRCLIVDDSIVRGNTARQLVKLVKQAGAKEVILVSTCPRIENPCYYGIDFPSRSELIAHNRTPKEIAEELGADRVVFQTVEGLKKALGQKSLCTGCLTGEYPTSVESAKDFEIKRLIDREYSPSKKKES